MLRPKVGLWLVLAALLFTAALSEDVSSSLGKGIVVERLSAPSNPAGTYLQPLEDAMEEREGEDDEDGFAWRRRRPCSRCRGRLSSFVVKNRIRSPGSKTSSFTRRDEASRAKAQESRLAMEVASDDELLHLSQEVKNGKFDALKFKSIALSNVTSLQALNDLKIFSGLLTIRDSPQLFTLEGLGNLTRIGSLLIEGNAKLNSTGHLPRLKIVNGDFKVKGNPALSSLSLPSLQSIEGNMEVMENSNVSTGDWPMLAKVGGAVVIEKNKALESVALPNLTFIGESLQVSENPDLKDFGFLLLAEIDRDLHILSNQNLSGFQLPALQAVGRDIAIRDNDEVTGFNLSALASVGRDLLIRSNQALETLHTLKNLVIGRDLVLRGNSHLNLQDLSNSFRSIGRDAEVKSNGAMHVAAASEDDLAASMMSEEEIQSLLPVGGYAYVSSNQG